MVSLAHRMGKILSAPFDTMGERLHDHFALGSLYEKQGHTDHALKAYRLAVLDSEDCGTVARANQRLSFLLKRLGQYDEAIDIWHALLGGDELYPYVELAKQYEHRLKDYDMAEQVVCEAIEWLQASGSVREPFSKERLYTELEHRLARVRRRKLRAPSCESLATKREAE